MSPPSPRHPTGSPGGGPIRRRRAGEAAVAVAALAVIVAVIVIGAGLVLGYRPVVITSGSMGAAAPQGAMAVAGPADSIEVGDIVVMQATRRWQSRRRCWPPRRHRRASRMEERTA